MRKEHRGPRWLGAVAAQLSGLMGGGINERGAPTPSGFVITLIKDNCVFATFQVFRHSAPAD